MHFICSTFGSAGDVFPMLGLALELRRRGHDITFATNGHFERVVAEHELPFEALGTEAEYQACITNPDLWHPRRSFQHVFTSMQPILRRQYEVHADRAGPSVVGLTNCFGLGAFNARDKLGMPVITVHLQPAVLWSDINPPTLPGMFGPRWLKSLFYRVGVRFFIDPIICPFLNAWRKELALPPVRNVLNWWNSRDGVLCMFPAWYAPPQADWPAGIMETDFPLWNHRSDQPLDESVITFLDAGQPPLVFTPGSANIHGQKFFAAAVQVCEKFKRRGILLTEFAEQLPAQLPPSIVHLRYVPLDRLLPRAAAFVHHGGIGSTSQAMLAGIPQVVMPLAHDQLDNGARIERLGIGASIPAPRFTAARLIDALKRLLKSSEVARQCREIAQRLAARDGLRHSADAVERMVAERSEVTLSRRVHAT